MFMIRWFFTLTIFLEISNAKKCLDNGKLAITNLKEANSLHVLEGGLIRISGAELHLHSKALLEIDQIVVKGCEGEGNDSNDSNEDSTNTKPPSKPTPTPTPPPTPSTVWNPILPGENSPDDKDEPDKDTDNVTQNTTANVSKKQTPTVILFLFLVCSVQYYY